MGIEVMTTVLAEAFSGTRPRPLTTNISSGSARRDEYNYQTTARDDNGYDRYNTNSFPAAATRQQNSAHCPARAPHTYHTVRRLHWCDHKGNHSSQSRRKPGGDEQPSHHLTTPQMQTQKKLHPACTVSPRASSASPEKRNIHRSDSPQEPLRQRSPIGRHRRTQRPSEQQPSMHDQCRRGEKRPPDESREVKTKRDAEEKTSSEEEIPPMKKKPSHGKTKKLPDTKKTPTPQDEKKIRPPLMKKIFFGRPLQN